MNYALIIILLLAFISLVAIFVIAHKKSNEPDKNKDADKTEKISATADDKTGKASDAKEKNKDDIPEILKEVTRGNYMYENSQLSEDEQLEVDMIENAELGQKNEEPFRVTLGEILSESDMGAVTTKDILEEMDAELDDDFTPNSSPSTQEHEPSVGDEIKSLSPKMKAILIADILKRKDK